MKQLLDDLWGYVAITGTVAVFYIIIYMAVVQ